MTDPLAPLRERFRVRAKTDRAALELLALGDAHGDELRRLVHNLAGTAGTFGYGSLSQAAVEIDDQIASGLPVDSASVNRLKDCLDEVLLRSS